MDIPPSGIIAPAAVPTTTTAPANNNNANNNTTTPAGVAVAGTAPHTGAAVAPTTTMVPFTPIPPTPGAEVRHSSGITPVLQNIVCTVNLDTRLDLKHITMMARNAEYNPRRFAAVIMRIREPKTTALIFASGKMVCTGAKSEELAKLASRKFARIIQKLGYPNAKFKV